jgi:hypothetical protein
MKRVALLLSVGWLCSAVTATAQTIDADLIDRISVDMPRAEVRALLGPPDARDALEPGLIAELYRLDQPGPMLASGLLYDRAGRVAGHAMVFSGAVGQRLTGLLTQRGYQRQQPAPARPGWWLTGTDDDTGHPQLVHIVEGPELTTLTTFARGFHEQRSRRP